MPSETFFNLPEEKRNRLLDILLEEFSENDYKNVSIGRIVNRANIAKGSFYQYFSDKEDCYLYLIQLGIEQKTALFRQTQPPKEVKTMFDQLRWLLKIGLQFELTHPQLAKIGFKAIFDDVPLPDETLKIIRQGGYAYFLQLVQASQAAGELKPGIDLETAAFLLNAAFTNLGQHLMERFKITPEQLAAQGGASFRQSEVRSAIEQVIAVLESGLKKPQEI